MDVYKAIRDRKKKEAEKKKRQAREKKWKKQQQQKISTLKGRIKKLLKVKAVKIPASDIDAYLKHKNVDEIKKLCEEMYQRGQISRTGNYRYFILIEKKTIPKLKKFHPTVEIRKYAKLRNDGIINEEEFQQKKKELLDL